MHRILPFLTLLSIGGKLFYESYIDTGNQFEKNKFVSESDKFQFCLTLPDRFNKFTPSKYELYRGGIDEIRQRKLIAINFENNIQSGQFIEQLQFKFSTDKPSNQFKKLESSPFGLTKTKFVENDP